jgi:hypothetical protein
LPSPWRAERWPPGRLAVRNGNASSNPLRLSLIYRRNPRNSELETGRRSGMRDCFRYRGKVDMAR